MDCHIWPLLWPKQRHDTSLDFEDIFLLWVCHSGPFAEWPKKLLILNGLCTCHESCSATWASGAWSASVGEGCCLELWQAPIDESQHRSLGFWSKVLLSSVNILLSSAMPLGKAAVSGSMKRDLIPCPGTEPRYPGWKAGILATRPARARGQKLSFPGSLPQWKIHLS